MKVLLIARTIAFGGGAEKLVFETYSLLKEKLGPENVMLVVFQPCSMFSFENVDYYETNSSIVFYCPFSGFG